MGNLDMLKSRFGKIYEFGCWNLERISADAGMQCTSTEFQDECHNHSVCLTLASMEHQEMNGKVKDTWRTSF